MRDVVLSGIKGKSQDHRLGIRGLKEGFNFFFLQCNNPLTKEPKLQQATRIVDEWVELDNEAKATDKEITNEQQNQNAIHDIAESIL